MGMGFKLVSHWTRRPFPYTDNKGSHAAPPPRLPHMPPTPGPTVFLCTVTPIPELESTKEEPGTHIFLHSV